MSSGFPVTSGSTGRYSLLGTKVSSPVSSPNDYASTPDSLASTLDSSASTLNRDDCLGCFFSSSINSSSSQNTSDRSPSNFETPSESPTDSNSPAGRSNDGTPFFSALSTPVELQFPIPVELQFPIDDVNEHTQVDPKGILKKELENLKRIVADGQNTFFTTSTNPFGVDKKIFLDFSPPPICPFLVSFIRDCSNCEYRPVDLDYYAMGLDILLLSHNILDENTRKSIAMNILTHLQCKVSEHLNQN